VNVLEQLRGGLIVSVQAWPGSALEDPYVIAAMAAAAEANGAAGVRIQGVANMRAVRDRVRIPMIGIIKREYPGFAPYITPTLEEVRAIVDCGAEIVAFDATARARPNGVTTEGIIEAILDAGKLAMADCATSSDALCAQADGADIVATTLHGYTEETKGSPLPALGMVREISELDAFVICEGGIHAPGQVGQALDSGADAVVVGTAITNIDWLVREFASLTTNIRDR
jgi:N-acylglucosamine-6-phosphate 2-epimerase